MREITKIISLPVGEETLSFRLSKLDAFSGARLLKLLSLFQENTEEGKAFSLSDCLLKLHHDRHKLKKSSPVGEP